MWALALSGPSGDLLASGGGDGAIALWEDCTAADADEAALLAEEAVLKDQDLANALKVSGWLAGWPCGRAGGRVGKWVGIGWLSGRAGESEVAASTCICSATTAPSAQALASPVAPCCPLLLTLLQDEDYERATALAFEMRHPGRLLAVVRQALERGQAEGAHLLGSLAAAMGPEDLRQCLEYCRQA